MRSKLEITSVWVKLFPQFSGSSATLQGRVKEMMVHSILAGLVPSNARIPPSRTLANALGLSRNTVALALQVLVDKGFLVSRARSGLFVNGDILKGQASSCEEPLSSTADLAWKERLVTQLSGQRNIVKPVNWQDYPYPFIYGQFDFGLMPLKDWRACSHQALLAPAVKKWSQDFIDRDYEPLVEQIQHRLLPARGIVARREEILLTGGAQMACYLLATVLLDRHTVVGIEDPGYPDARNNFKMCSDNVRALPIDQEGLVASGAFERCSYVYLTPSHQCPTTVTMSMERRHQILQLAQSKNVVLFEDDHESELNFCGQPLPALKSLDSSGRVIYLGSLSKTLAHGLRLGFIVGPAELIKELRSLRRLITRHIPTNNAHTASLFISQGHHEAFIRKLNITYRERRAALVAAMASNFPEWEVTPSQGGSGAWLRGPAGLDSEALAKACAASGVLLEPGAVFFNRPSAATRNCFRMGYSAIPANMIAPGIEMLHRVYSAL